MSWPPPALLYDRWRSRNLAGAAKHALIVRVRPGHMERGYLDTRRIDDGSTPFNGSPIFPPLIWKGDNHHCWKGQWVADGDWVEVREVQSANHGRTFQDKGTSTLTVVADTIGFVDHTGPGGLYRTIERGYFSPMRGIKVNARPDLWQPNSWENVLNGGWQIELWEGYGQGADIELAWNPTTNSWAPASGALARTWTGIVSGCDLDSAPDMASITARDFGVLFTDQRLMGHNKAAEIRSPVTFADRRRTQGEQKLTGPLTVSSGAVDGDGEWRSAAQGSPTDKQWIEITLAAGFYTDAFLAAMFDGMEMWISLYDPVGAVVDHATTEPAGWVDLGLGTVPGSGIPWIRHAGNVAASPSRRWYLGHGYDVHNGSKLRFTFTDLSKQGAAWYAGTNEVAAYRYGWDPLHPPGGAPGINAKHWILVDDASDVARMLLIWLGFQEWHVDDFGWTLFAPIVFGEDKFFSDAIDDLLSQGNFVFFMGAPTADDRSIGVPHFVAQNAVTASSGAPVLEVRDTDMIEAPQVTWALQDLPHVIRYRGSVSKAGQTLGQDLVKRFMATYYPPWAGVEYTPLGSFASSTQLRRTAGVVRHFSETLGVVGSTAMDSNAECLFACVLAAIQYALGMVTGQFQFAGLPGLELNQLVSVVEEGTGANSRVWVASLQSEHQMGEQGFWRVSLGGALLDTQEMASIMADYAYAWKLNQRHKASL